MASTVAGYIGKINPGNNVQYALGSTAYAICSTPAATAAKAVDMTGFSLVTGATVFIKFQYANSASNPTLNVDGTGAKPIYLYGTTRASTASATTGWYAGAVICFTYDGTGWVRDQGYNTDTTYTNASLGSGYGTCSVSASAAAKVVTLSGYTASTGGIVSVKFTNAVPENSSLNINNQGEYAIFFNGTNIASGIIIAGDLATFIYDGTQYHLIAIDRWGTNINTLLANSVTAWNAGSMTSVTYDNEVLTIENGTAPALTRGIQL